MFLEIYFPSYKFIVVVKRLDPNISPESRVKEMITNYRSSWLLNKFSLSASLKICRYQYGEYAYWCQVVFSTWFSFMHFQKSHISKEGREFKRKIGDQSAWTQVGKWCALIEGALYFLREGWLGNFIFTGIMIISFLNFFF